MRRTILLLLFIFLHYLSFSQSARLNDYSGQAIVKNLYPVVKSHKKTDTIKSVCYPIISVKPAYVNWRINARIRGIIFGVRDLDTVMTPQYLVNAIHKHYKDFKMTYEVNYNKNGLLSITITSVSAGTEIKSPIYLTFDLNTGNLVTLNDMLNTRNDSISMRQAIIPPITDSVRLFELSVDKKNPKYGEIIEGLNTGLANFLQNYPFDFILKEQELIVYYNCSLPDNLLHYFHLYKVSFRYKTLKNVLKPEIAKRLL